MMRSESLIKYSLTAVLALGMFLFVSCSEPANNSIKSTKTLEENKLQQNHLKSQKLKETPIPSANVSKIKVITDIKNWNHPVKDILFDYYNFKLYKVELLNNETYPVFYVNFPFVLDESTEYYLRDLFEFIAEANSYWDYEIKDIEKTLDIKVSCDRKNKRVIDVKFNGDDRIKKILNVQSLNDYKFTINDFCVSYNNAKMTVTDSPEKLFEKWGLGEAKSHNDALVGPSLSHTFDRYEYVYPLNSSVIAVGVFKYFDNKDIGYSSSKIVYFDLTECGTSRGIKGGDTYFDMIQRYGRPNNLGLVVSGEAYCEYYFKNIELRIDFDKSFKIMKIQLLRK